MSGAETTTKVYDERRGGYRQSDNRNADQGRGNDHNVETRANSVRVVDNRQDDSRDSGQRSNTQSDSDNRNMRDTRVTRSVSTFDDGDDEDDRPRDRPRPRDQGGDNSNPPRQSRSEQQIPQGDVSRKRKSPPQEGPQTRKQRSPPQGSRTSKPLPFRGTGLQPTRDEGTTAGESHVEPTASVLTGELLCQGRSG